jgi:hypothetical protein
LFQGYTPELDSNNNVIITDASFRTANLNASFVKGNLIATTAVVGGIELSSYSQAAYAQANVTIGVDTTQNTRLTVSEGVDLSQNVRLDYSNTAITIAQGVDNSQNVRIDFSNTAITIIQGVDTTQNTNIAATDGKMLSAYNTANNAVANIGPVITTNSVATVIIANTTSSTSNTTGALVVSGGMGVASNINSTGIISANSYALSGSPFINSNRTLTYYGTTHNQLGSGSGTRDIDLTLGNFVSATVAGTTTWTFSNPIASPASIGFVLELINGGSAALTWPAAVKWPGGTAPTLTASGVDVLTFITDDGGTTWRGVVSMLDSK